MAETSDDTYLYFGGRRPLAIVPELVRAAETSERVLSRRLRELAGISLRDLLVLDCLERSGGEGIRTKRLAGCMSISTSRLAYQLKCLESAGWVARSPHAEDGRGVVVSLTPEGAAACRRGTAALESITCGGFAALADRLPTKSLEAAYDALVTDEAGASTPDPLSVARFGVKCVEALDQPAAFGTTFDSVAGDLMEILGIELVRLIVKVDGGLTCVALRQTSSTPIAGPGTVLPESISVPSAEVCETGKPIFTATREQLEAGFPGLVRFYDASGIVVGARFSVPIQRDGLIVGSMSGGSSKPLEWDETSRPLVAMAATTIAQRLERAGGSDAATGALTVGAMPTIEEGLKRSLMTAIAWGLEPGEAAEFLEVPESRAQAMIANAVAEYGVEGLTELVERLREERDADRLVRGATASPRP